MTSLCLERAGAVPLAVDITISDIRCDKDFLGPLLPYTSRISCLRLAGFLFVETVAVRLPGLFHSPMLNLTSLELEQTIEPIDPLPLSENPPSSVFQHVAKLKSLCLTRTPLYPALLNVMSLRELKLLGYTNPFRFGTLIRFLHSNPNLETVVLDIHFVEGSVEIAPVANAPLPRLQHLSVTCSKAVDSRGLLSCISLPRGVHLEVTSTQPDQHAQLGTFLPSPPTPVLEMLGPITTIKTQLTPQELQVFGDGSAFIFRSSKALLGIHPEFMLFSTATVRELYTNIHPFTYHVVTAIPWLLGLLPALETLAFSKIAFPLGLLSALTQEPVLCPALRTIAFFDCGVNSDLIQGLGEAITKRRDLMAARLYQVVIVDSAGMLPDLASIQQLRKSIPCVKARMDDKLPDLS